MREYVEIDIDRCAHETDRAILVVIDKEKHWIPKGQLSLEEDVPDTSDDPIPGGSSCFVERWWAEKNGLV